MSNSRRTINILIGLILCGFMAYGAWGFPNVWGGDISLSELEAQNSATVVKVWVWRVVSLVLVLALFAWVVKKNSSKTNG